MGNFQELQHVQKINVHIVVGRVTEVFSCFTVSECIALLIKTYWYITNTSCSHLTPIVLPDFCTGKTKDD